MADNRWKFPGEIAPGNAEHKTSEGKEFPFPHIPLANSNTFNDTLSTYLKNRDGEQGGHKPRARSQSHSTGSISNLLLVVTERLGKETNRANALDARCAEVLAHLRTIVENRDQLRRSLAKVQEELGLYKLQLDVAQNENFWAQKIVDGDPCAATFSERAVWIAREEGRNEGFKEGLREGRRWAHEASRKRAQRTRARTPTEEYTDGLIKKRSTTSQKRTSHHDTRLPLVAGTGPLRPGESVHSTLPDAASYASTLPIHTTAQPDPSDKPSNRSNPSLNRTSSPSSESHHPPRALSSAQHTERPPPGQIIPPPSAST
ncbi:hypothetical protein C8J57DRAFT_1512886 [Mycena rebaudengoi]|nr:hypothetical protein C8J57DRAFT_1512886 [Mycena rebaudengoi]